jgi:hypothetical protein
MSCGTIFFNRLRIQCMVFSIEHQLELPDDFPAQDMVAFMAAARTVTLSPRKSLAWIELGGASNLIGWRFRSCHEDMSTYIESWKRCGSHVSFEEIYLREKALFGMFTAGVSCIETACYALYDWPAIQNYLRYHSVKMSNATAPQLPFKNSLQNASRLKHWLFALNCSYIPKNGNNGLRFEIECLTVRIYLDISA